MKVDFYILKETDTRANWLFACRLIDKAQLLGHQIFILCNNKEDAIAFDELLWQFEPSSFIPHHIQGEGPIPAPKVQIGYTETAPGFNDILINLSLKVPDIYKQFRRICEIVPSNESAKSQKRLNYRFYQEQNLKIQSHHID